MFNKKDIKKVSKGVIISLLIIFVTTGVYAANSSIQTYISNFSASESEIGKLINGFFDSEGYIKTEFIKEQTISGSKLVNNSVDGSKLINSSIGASKIKSNEIQKRIINSCPSDEAIQSILEDGSVTCVGSGGIIGGGTLLNSSLWTENNSNIYRFLGNVGIGTINPKAKLEVKINDYTPIIMAGYYVNNNVTPGGRSIAMGDNVQATGLNSVAMGYYTKASNSSSTAMGISTQANGMGSTAMGISTQANGIGSTAMGISTQANGNYSTAMGISTQANGNYSTAMGNYTQATGFSSVAMGYYTKASNSNSTAMGSYTQANGIGSTAMGNYTQATGFSSTSMGYFTKANGNYSTSMGYYTQADTYYSTIFGKYGQTAWDDLFAVAYGNSGDQNIDGAGLVFKIKTNGNVYADGSFNSNGADYAEYFEADNLNELKVGDLVGFNEKTGKVRKYKIGDEFIGIVSDNPSVIGNLGGKNEEEQKKWKKTHILVGLLGQLDFNKSQVKIKARKVYTIDGKKIGLFLNNGKILLK